MKKITRFLLSLFLAFFIGFFLAGGRDVLRPETLTRFTDWFTAPTAAPAPSAEDETGSPRTIADAPNDSPFESLRRLIFLPDAVNERVPARHFVPIDRLPPRLIQAVVAVEDARFYSHPGFDLEAIARATLVNLQSGEIEEGASTITQQLVKNLFLSPEQSMGRKVEELALAIDFECRYSKNEILALYLNTIYFGSATTASTTPPTDISGRNRPSFLCRRRPCWRGFPTPPPSTRPTKAFSWRRNVNSSS